MNEWVVVPARTRRNQQLPLLPSRQVQPSERDSRLRRMVQSHAKQRKRDGWPRMKKRRS